MRSSLLLKRALFLTTALSLTLNSGQAMAEGAVITLDAITIIATKTEDAVVDTLSGTSVVTEESLRRGQPNLISELLNAVPGVEVQEDSDNPAAAINIRGLQDFGRVNVMIDGARQNFQASGHGPDGVFYLDPALIKQVDIVRGPVSAIYGSGAIAGVVNFELLEGSDIVLPGEKWAVRQKLAYASNDKEFLSSSTVAFMPSEQFSFIANGIYRKDKNYKDGDGNRILNTDDKVQSGYAKAVFTANNGHTLKLGYLHQKNDYTTGVVGAQRDTDTIDKTGTFKWLYDAPENPWIDIHLSAYTTTTDSTQLRLDGSFAGNSRTFKIRTSGVDFFNTSEFDTGQLSHKLTYGADYFKDTVKTNDPGNSGDEFTPSGERKAYGYFIQDQVQITDWLRVVAALRYDGYQLDGVDNNATPSTPVNIKGSNVSPKATIAIKPVEGIEFYGTYAEGYRAPALTETLNSGTHDPAFPFVFLPNPFLKPETAHNIEVGVNLKFDDVFKPEDKVRVKATIYRNDVDDFIEGDLSFTPNPSCPSFACFQYRNVAEARLKGFELEANYDAGFAFARLAYTYTQGEDLIANQPLASVRPHKFVSTLGMRFLEERLEAGVTWTAVGAKKAKDIPAGSGLASRDSFNVVDLFATYEHNRYFSMALTLKNVLDKNYTKYLNQNASEGFSAVISATFQLGG